MSLTTIFIFFVILLVLVLVHEAGHFFAAKLSKMRVDEFAFGFPPKLFGIRRGETEYNFNALPLGGYVRIHGENGADENSLDHTRAFDAKPWYTQIFVLSAGVIMNLVLAWILFSIAFMVGAPSSKESTIVNQKYVSNVATVISQVGSNSPAMTSGLTSGDVIKNISAPSGESIVNPESSTIPAYIQRHSSEPITFTVEKLNGDVKVYTVTPLYNTELDKSVVGISTSEVGVYRAPAHVALISGVSATIEFTRLTIIGFKDLIVSLFQGEGARAAEALTGPVGIVGLVADAQKSGFVAIIIFAALISVNLAVLNILPLPALDGGRILFVLIETLLGKKLPITFQAAVNGVSFLLLIILMVYVTIKDISKLF
jgi:regulator of sigma E protease